MTSERLQYLFRRYSDSDLTAAELEEFYAYVNTAEPADLETLMDERYAGQQITANAAQVDWNTMFAHITTPEPKVVPFGKSTWWRISVAASIILAICIGGYFAFFNTNKKPDNIVTIEPAKDVKAPETNRAMVKLASGETVYLDSAANGQLSKQGNIALVKLANGQIVYQTSSGEIIKELQYNTLTNPKGSKVIDMTLADGSRVWLNAGSSVTYPIAFIGNDRNVTITGEAYFEVASDKTKPFRVSKGDMTVEVLGTHFNVNAYEDEDDIKVTLLEGSVKVTGNQSSLTIKPDQQAIVSGNDVKLNSNVNVEEVMAWKNGLFQFEGAGIETVMRQISRWYDVEVVYEYRPADQHFRGEIGREVEASKVFRMLEATGTVHFRIEGKKVFVIK